MLTRTSRGARKIMSICPPWRRFALPERQLRVAEAAGGRGSVRGMPLSKALSQLDVGRRPSLAISYPLHLMS
jgi:hypothetical protein